MTRDKLFWALAILLLVAAAVKLLGWLGLFLILLLLFLL